MRIFTFASGWNLHVSNASSTHSLSNKHSPPSILQQTLQIIKNHQTSNSHPLLMHMMNRMLQLVDRSTRIQILGAGMRAVHNRMASIQLVRIVQTLQSLLRHLITGIGDPSVRLLQNRRTQVLISVPPVRRARRRAAGAENALVQAVQKQTVLVRLQILHLVVRAHRRFLLQPRLDRRVLLVEVRQI